MAAPRPFHCRREGGLHYHARFIACDEGGLHYHARFIACDEGQCHSPRSGELMVAVGPAHGMLIQERKRRVSDARNRQTHSSVAHATQYGFGNAPWAEAHGYRHFIATR
jgi:hypothetical protein